MAMASVPVSSALLALSKRQTGVAPNNFPPQCEPGCTSILATISSCDAVACLCTSANIAAYQSCINCLVASTNATQAIVAAGLTAIDEINSECAGKGVASLTQAVATAGATGTGTTTTTATGSSGPPNPTRTNEASLNAVMSVAGLAGIAVFQLAATVL
ncbi:hypothetical protein HWV62_2047 [Athelia sp. TMB]|nr:hypothetical protein HWV62_2047 [Athelia sp. TMB]